MKQGNEIKEQTLLAEKLRPTLHFLEGFVGPARRIWDRELAAWRERGKFHCIFWGPPGCGKTTLAKLLGEFSHVPFTTLSAVRDGVKEIRQAVENNPPGSILFLDEIHRLSRTQQEVLLPILEHSEAWVLGATTEPPTTSLIPAILSRVRLIYVHPIGEEDIKRALSLGFSSLLQEQKRSLEKEELRRFQEELLPRVAKISLGDVRFALNLLEGLFLCNSVEEEETLLKNTLKAFTSKNHYENISAMIKSMRGSDPDAALFYAVSAVDQGEDPLFILRRCIIFASEDVGNADPQALNIAVNAYQAVENVGMPEGIIPLAQCVTYLSSTVKSNRSYNAIHTVRRWKKQAEERGSPMEIPKELTLKGQSDYKYPHDYPNSFVPFTYLPRDIQKIKEEDKRPAYLPSDIGVEGRLRARLAELWKR